jgi:hypothetical protein
VISGRQLHGQEALTNQFMYYAQSTALSRAVHGVPIPVRCTMSQSPCGARCANPRAVHGVPIPVRLLTVPGGESIVIVNSGLVRLHEDGPCMVFGRCRRECNVTLGPCGFWV